MSQLASRLLTIFRCNEVHISSLFPTRLDMIMDGVWSNWNGNQKRMIARIKEWNHEKSRFCITTILV